MTKYIITRDQIAEIIHLARFASVKSIRHLLMQLPIYSEKPLKEQDGEGDAPTKSPNTAEAGENSGGETCAESSPASEESETEFTGEEETDNSNLPQLSNSQNSQLNKSFVQDLENLK